MYNDLFTIGPLTVHGYGLMIGLGFLLCVLMGSIRAKKRGMDGNAVVDIALIGILCGFVGAKLLYCIVEFRRFLASPLSVLGSDGFVVYGGIVTGILSAVFTCRRKGLAFIDYFDLLAPSIALAQGFGRIGCFLAGCCYGRETHSGFAIVFPHSDYAPSGVPLVPTQLLSSAGDFLIVILLLLFHRYAKKRNRGDVGALYLLLYAVGRFVLEFFRGDVRGSVGPLSTSQFISILIALFAVWLFFRDRSRPVPAGAPEEDAEEEDAEEDTGEDAEEEEE